MKKIKLTLDLVPSSCWYSNVRSILNKKRWDDIKRLVSTSAWDTCEICGGIGPKHPVECHEVWKYDDKKLTQKLVRLIALCPKCHMVKHFGLAQLNDKRDVALKHFMKVNGVTRAVAEAYIANEFMVWARRSSKDWKLDVSVLKKYDIDLDKINVPIA